MEVDLLARRITQVIAAKRGSSQAPARIRREGHRNLRQADARNIVPVDIGLWNERRVGGANQSRRKYGQDTGVEESTLVE